jgi:hypothetical protein
MAEQTIPPTLQEQLLADLFHPSASRSPREHAAMGEIIELRKQVAELKSKLESGASRARSKRVEGTEGE